MILKQRLPVWLLAGLLAAGAVACSADEETPDKVDATDASDATDAADATDTTDPTNTNSGECAESGFSVGNSAATAAQGSWGIAAANADGTAVIRIDSFADWNGPTSAGNYDLGGINYKDCGLCLMIASDCQQGQNCQTTWYADAGNVNITELNTQVDGTVELNLEGVVFTEVTISEDYTSTPVANARTWCMDQGFSGTFTDPDQPDLSGATVPDAVEATCVAEGNGKGVGANLGDFTLTNCHGDAVNVHSLACNAETKAAWFVASADWCGPCHVYADIAKERLDNGNQGGVVFFDVIGEDLNYNPATIETCRSYADQHNLPYEEVFFDPSWETLYGNIWPYPTVQGGMYLPWVGIAKGENLEYVYSSQFNGSDYPADTYTGETILNELAGVPGPADTDTPDDGGDDTGSDDTGTDGTDTDG